jgi:hypothetical protein
VPRPAQDVTASTVPEPSELFGDVPSTYLNYGLKNLSISSATSFNVEVYRDGVQILQNAWLGLAGGNTLSRLGSTGHTISAGRHMLSMVVDRIDLVRELDEENNTYGSQYVWVPQTVGIDVQLTRAQPPEPTGHWEYTDFGESTYFNSDGVRTPLFATTGDNGYWAAIAVMPDENSDVDVRLHNVSTGARDGFGASLVASSWPTAQSDFVLANFNNVSRSAFDVGVLQGISGKVEDYTLSITQSFFLGSDPNGSFGAFSMPSDAIVRLYEFEVVTPAVHVFGLESGSGLIDYGVSLYGGADGFHSKEDVFGGTAIAFTEGVGVRENFEEALLVPGYYCVAVWKVGTADRDQGESFTLEITRQSATAVGDAIPDRTALVGIAPNPFNPNTSLSFDLAIAGDVELVVYSARGRAIRTLHHGPLAAGHHSVRWDGRDDQAQGVASGSYYVSMKTAAGVEVRKLTLLK